MEAILAPNDPLNYFDSGLGMLAGGFEFISLTYACRLVLCEAWGAFTGEATDRVDAQELTVVLLGWALVQIWMK